MVSKWHPFNPRSFNKTGQLMLYQDFLDNYHCKKTNFLHYYQVISAILKHWLTMARNEALKKNFTLIIPLIFSLTNLFKLTLWKLELVIFTNYSTPRHTLQNIRIPKMDSHFSTKRFASASQFKLMHQIVVTKRELFHYGIQSDDDCVYWSYF